MARIFYGYPVTEVVGSIGGVTFQRNTSGTIARLKPNMTVNPSPAQALQQGKLSRLVALWPTLTIAEKASWTTNLVPHLHTNPWGDQKTLSGYQWFMSCNINLLIAGEAPRNTSPAWSIIAPPNAFTLTASVISLTAIWPVNYSVAPNYLFVYITLPLRQASLKLRRSLFLKRINNTFDGTVFTLTPAFIELTNVVWADFYNSSDANIICRIMVVETATGLASAFTSSIVKIG